MKPEDLKKLCQQPESETLEFKLRVPNIHRIASQIVAFANTNGGKLIIGVEEGKGIVGIDNVKHTYNIVNKATSIISPPLKIDIQIVEIDGKKILVAEIPKGDKSPYFTKSKALQRVGDSNVPLTSEFLASNINKRSTSIEKLHAEINNLSTTIEKLNKDLISASSWKNKIVDMLIGGVIGAFISLVIALVIAPIISL